MINGIIYLSSAGFFSYISPSVISIILLVNIHGTPKSIGVPWALAVKTIQIESVRSNCSVTLDSELMSVMPCEEKSHLNTIDSGPHGPGPNMGCHLALSLEQTTRITAKSQINSISVDNLSEKRKVKSTLGNELLMLIKFIRRCQFSTWQCTETDSRYFLN